jgi:hypothetical protein
MTLQIAELEPHVGDGRIKLEYRRTENQMGSISTEMKAEIQPSRVRYIKLGDGGRWEQECLDKRIIRLGFGSSRVDRFHLCDAGRWEELAETFIAEGKDRGTATRFTNETRLFFEDDGSTLWLTFVGEQLWWGFMDTARAKPHQDGKGVWRSIASGWRSKDLNGAALTKERLSGALAKLAAYRGTSCRVDCEGYAVRRINGQKIPEVERAIRVLEETKLAVIDLMKLLGDRDFEMLVDLVFSTSGWRRQGTVGKTQKTLDLDLVLPSTGERAFVQVKSKTTSAELAEYVGKIADLGPYDRMFYVYHSGEAFTDDERVIVLTPVKLADLVLDAGLMTWLVRKVS